MTIHQMSTKTVFSFPCFIARVCEAYNSQYTPLLVFCIGLHCSFSALLVHDRSTLPCLRVLLRQLVPNSRCYLARRISQIRCRHLERAIMIDYRKKHKTLRYLSGLTVTGSKVCTTSALYGSRGVEPGSLLRRTSLLIQVEETFSPSQRRLVR